MQLKLRPAGLHLPTEERLERADDFRPWESEGKIRLLKDAQPPPLLPPT